MSNFDKPPAGWREATDFAHLKKLTREEIGKMLDGIEEDLLRCEVLEEETTRYCRIPYKFIKVD